MSQPGPRGCHGVNKHGKPCGVAAITDTDYCSRHTEGHPAKIRFERGEGHTTGPGRPSKFDEWREQVLGEFEVWVAPYREAVTGAMESTTYLGQVVMSPHPDLAARMGATEKVFDRLWGKPTQKQEVEHSGGVNLDVVYGTAPLESTDTPEEEA